MKHIMYTYNWQVVQYTYICVYIFMYIYIMMFAIYIYICSYIYICIYIYMLTPPWSTFDLQKQVLSWMVFCALLFFWCIYAVFLYCLYVSRNHCIFKKNLMILWSCLFYGNAFFAFIAFIPESFQFHNIHFKHVELRI